MCLFINIFFLIRILRLLFIVCRLPYLPIISFCCRPFDLISIFLRFNDRIQPACFVTVRDLFGECSLEVIPITVGYIIAFSIIFTYPIVYDRTREFIIENIFVFSMKMKQCSLTVMNEWKKNPESEAPIQSTMHLTREKTLLTNYNNIPQCLS
jgi:hypothetical protein